MQIHVLLTCSKRKKGTERALRLSDIRRRTLEQRARAWVEALQRQAALPIPARDLYQGEQWSLARHLEDEPPIDRDIQLWILSAGYGLVPFDAPLLPYSATFSRRHPDSVFNPDYGLEFDEIVQRWWTLISEWGGPVSGPRSIPDLADGEAVLMVAASPVYLRAVRAELKAAAERMEASERLLVFSAGSEDNGATHPSVLSFDSRLQSRLGGSLMALNARVLDAILRENCPLERGAVQEVLEGWMASAPRPERPVRSPMTDAEVRQFIAEELRKDPAARWTPLLRRLRVQLARSCEQTRFRSLFRSVSEDTAFR